MWSQVTSATPTPISATINYSEWYAVTQHIHKSDLRVVPGYISYTPAPITPISSSINHNEMVSYNYVHTHICVTLYYTFSYSQLPLTMMVSKCT